MLLSMTGYGRASTSEAGKTYTVEIRSLNSKQSDLRLRTSQQLHKYEVVLRKEVLNATKRGKLEMIVDIKDETGGGTVAVNLPLLGGLYDEVAHRMGKHTKYPIQDDHLQGVIAGLLRTPGVIEAGTSELTETEWLTLQRTARECLERLHSYRLQEGKVLADDLGTSCEAIVELLDQVSAFEEARVQAVRDRMSKQLEDFLGRSNVDKNRFEQEVLFYLEKMDINEEKIRLAQNCKYFLEILGNDDEIKGRKLNFISQEIGREVNTLGAKAYSADIQKLVVNMKEHLEMIKEQLANVA
ncbi:YicC family protein [Lewinella sp. W8]|uniref:YicC family protein n=1 Tax=Lewinella sp. W8 TaxID=2528208 RepID=UPI001068ABD7|nr:DUF1732 domain-containing protein [Lewinella sp. W8]MTB49502.1 YicC family protein [Lewinella sp. W8]